MEKLRKYSATLKLYNLSLQRRPFRLAAVGSQVSQEPNFDRWLGASRSTVLPVSYVKTVYRYLIGKVHKNNITIIELEDRATSKKLV